MSLDRFSDTTFTYREDVIRTQIDVEPCDECGEPSTNTLYNFKDGDVKWLCRECKTVAEEDGELGDEETN
jgi:hypothetical protein